MGNRLQPAKTKWHIAAVVTAAAVAPCVAGCGPNPVDPPTMTPVALQDPACIGNVAPAPSRIPADFVPVEALVCGEKITGNPRSTPGPYLYTRYQGDFSGVVDDFGRRDRKRNENCIASVIELPEVWLINEAGMALIPRYPMDECGTSNIKALNSILELPIAEQRQLIWPPTK